MRRNSAPYIERARRILDHGADIVAGDVTDVASLTAALDDAAAIVMTHGAPYGSGDYDHVRDGEVAAAFAVRMPVPCTNLIRAARALGQRGRRVFGARASRGRNRRDRHEERHVPQSGLWTCR